MNSTPTHILVLTIAEHLNSAFHSADTCKSQCFITDLRELQGYIKVLEPWQLDRIFNPAGAYYFASSITEILTKAECGCTAAAMSDYCIAITEELLDWEGWFQFTSTEFQAFCKGVTSIDE